MRGDFSRRKRPKPIDDADGVLFGQAQPKVLGSYGLNASWAQTTGTRQVQGPNGPGPGPATGPVYAAARRFAALPPATRHAWLAAHLAALRSGQLTLADLP